MKTITIFALFMSSAALADYDPVIDYYNQIQAERQYEEALRAQQENEQMQRVYQQMQEEQARALMRQQQNSFIIQQKSSLFPTR